MQAHGPFQYQVDEDLVVEAMRRHMLRRLTGGFVGKLFILVLGLLVLLLVLDLALYGRLSATSIAFVVAIPSALLMINLWLVPRLARRQFRQSAALRAPSTIAWDGELIHLACDRGESRIPITALYRWDRTDRAILLYQTEMMFNPVPKAALGEAADRLIARIEEAGVKRN